LPTLCEDQEILRETWLRAGVGDRPISRMGWADGALRKAGLLAVYPQTPKGGRGAGVWRRPMRRSVRREHATTRASWYPSSPGDWAARSF